MVRKNTVAKDPIGSTTTSIKRRSTRSLRRKILEASNKGFDMDPQNLVDYNPKLAEVGQGTRVAYVKFMTTKLKKKMESDDNEGGVKIEEEVRNAALRSSFNELKSIMKQGSQIKGDSIEELPVDPKDDKITFRVRSPIIEDPSEESIGSLELPETSENPLRRMDSIPVRPPSPIPPSSPVVDKKLDEIDENVSSPSCSFKRIDSTPVPSRSATPTTSDKSHSPTPPDHDDGTLKVNEKDRSKSATPDHGNSLSAKSASRSPSPTPSLNVEQNDPQPSSPGRSVSPATSDKGKSIISGKTITGWI